MAGLRVDASPPAERNADGLAGASMLQADLIIMGLRLPVGREGQVGYHVGAPATGATTAGAGGDDETTTVDADAETADLDRWFLSSMRPPDPCSPEIEGPEAMTARHPERGWRRRAGWVFVATCLIFGLCIVATAAARARARTTPRATDQDSQTVAGTPQRLASGVLPPAPSVAGAPVGATAKVEAASSAHASHTTTAPVSPSPRTANRPSSRAGNVRLPRSALGHRLFVDGQVAGEATALVRLPCGHHTVRIGGQGREHSVEVPCGATIALAQ